MVIDAEALQQFFATVKPELPNPTASSIPFPSVSPIVPTYEYQKAGDTGTRTLW